MERKQSKHYRLNECSRYNNYKILTDMQKQKGNNLVQQKLCSVVQVVFCGRMVRLVDSQPSPLTAVGSNLGPGVRIFQVCYLPGGKKKVGGSTQMFSCICKSLKVNRIQNNIWVLPPSLVVRSDVTE